MRIKRLAAFLLSGMLFLSQSISTQAQVPPTELQSNISDVSISPQWTNVNDVTLDLYFENGEACCSGIIRALSGTSKISATFKLERKNASGWTLVKSWSKSSSTNSLSFFETDAVTSGFTYRLRVSADVKRNGVTETISNSVEGNY